MTASQPELFKLHLKCMRIELTRYQISTHLPKSFFFLKPAHKSYYWISKARSSKKEIHTSRMQWNGLVYKLLNLGMKMGNGYVEGTNLSTGIVGNPDHSCKVFGSLKIKESTHKALRVLLQRREEEEWRTLIISKSKKAWRGKIRQDLFSAIWGESETTFRAINSFRCSHGLA